MKVARRKPFFYLRMMEANQVRREERDLHLVYAGSASFGVAREKMQDINSSFAMGTSVRTIQCCSGPKQCFPKPGI